jgi:peptidoglycan/LPS O-acetylase OafA/YrhL
MGTLVKKYFDKVCKYIFDNNVIMLISTVIMIVGAIAYINNYYVQFETKLILSIVGILSIFYFFMRNGDYMDNSRVGKGLQYIGRRTLDVYLLHYFFVTNSLTWINKWGVTSPTMKFVLSILTALVIIGICLLISKFLRTNPLLGKILFGAKMPQKTKN